jgi:tetratricopeptide (TPR) repeat protein
MRRGIINRIGLICVFIFFLSGCSIINFSGLFGDKDDENALLESSKIEQFLSKVRPWPGNPRSHYLLASNYLKAGKSQEAIAEFKKTILIDPLSAEAYNGMGMAYDQQGDFSRAVAHYKTAIKIRPDMACVYNNLGYSYLLQGKYELAIENFNKAIAMNLKDPAVRNNLALAYSRIDRAADGQMDKAPVNEKAEEVAQSIQPAEKRIPAVTEEAIQGIQAASLLKEIAAVQKPAPATEAAIPVSPQAGTGSSRRGSKQAYAITCSDVYKSMPSIGIEVSNGNGVTRMARNVSSYLAEKGFKMGRLTNAPAFNLKETRIFYRRGYGPIASRLSDSLPGVQKEEERNAFDRAQIKIKIVLGRDIVPYKSVFENKADKGARKS